MYSRLKYKAGFVGSTKVPNGAASRQCHPAPGRHMPKSRKNTYQTAFLNDIFVGEREKVIYSSHVALNG